MGLEMPRSHTFKRQKMFYGYLRTSKVFGEKKESKFAKVAVAGISTSGLTLRTLLRLPINENITWRFQTELTDKPVSIEGTLVNSAYDRSGYVYQMRLLSDEQNRECLLQLITDLHTRKLQLDKILSQYETFNNCVSQNHQVNYLC